LGRIVGSADQDEVERRTIQQRGEDFPRGSGPKASHYLFLFGSGWNRNVSAGAIVYREKHFRQRGVVGPDAQSSALEFNPYSRSGYRRGRDGHYGLRNSCQASTAD
jgi:hypothetical protein